MKSKTWGKVRATVHADKALRAGLHDAETTRGFQKKRTDNPPPADDRPASVNTHSALYPHGGGYAPPPGQDRAPQQNHYLYTGQAAYPPSQDQHPNQDHDPRYNPQQHPIFRNNTFPSSQGSAFNQMNHPTAYQGLDSRSQYPPHQDQDSSQDPYRQHRPTSSSRMGSDQGYSGQPYQDRYPHTSTSPEAYNHGQSDYRDPNPYGQGPLSDPPHFGPPGRASTVPANFSNPYGAPSNSGSYNGGGYNGNNNHGGGYY